jgi:hypothetical protein
VIRITTWPEHVTGERARRGKKQRDHATCTWDGREFRVLALSATTSLARALVAAGCPDQPWQAFTPEGTPSLRGRSLHAWAKLTVTEGDAGFRQQPYAEHWGTRQTAADAEDDAEPPTDPEAAGVRPLSHAVREDA